MVFAYRYKIYITLLSEVSFYRLDCFNYLIKFYIGVFSRKLCFVFGMDFHIIFRTINSGL